MSGWPGAVSQARASSRAARKLCHRRESHLGHNEALCGLCLQALGDVNDEDEEVNDADAADDGADKRGMPRAVHKRELELVIGEMRQAGRQGANLGPGNRGILAWYPVQAGRQGANLGPGTETGRLAWYREGCPHAACVAHCTFVPHRERGESQVKGDAPLLALRVLVQGSR